ncbi:advanced glycosylation end product-specific receptor [Latimeria chalumnae]|uniref:advanced glycosylation end product-specific receptor n=1 Tax=Latimeria chalumnae TaxID=7897 RepID=UPI0003C13E7E|nr:PREDICTED: advanced glycosylation end product-specific receptor [Latimeria chalumnae]|eukprot:XP_006013436.1 PREDICTED: advanced glycosylation end product-specific receptor [Latimeria chalumnae]
MMAAGVSALGVLLVVLATIQGACSVRSNTQTLTVHYGERLVLNCRVQHHKHAQILEWKTNATAGRQWELVAVLQGENRTSYREEISIFPNGSLVLYSVSLSHEGSFQCQTMRDGLEQSSLVTLNVFKAAKPPMIKAESQPLEAGNYQKIGTCISEDGYPAGHIRWLKNEEILSKNKSDTDASVRTVVRKDQDSGLYTVESSLYYTPQRKDADATFYCEVIYAVKDQQSVQRSRPLNIDLHYSLLDVLIEVLAEKETISEGDHVTLVCLADARPSPMIQWMKGDFPIPETGAKLDLPLVNRTHSGVYTCKATDFDFNEMTDNVTLDVQESQILRSSGKDLRTLQSLGKGEARKVKSVDRAGMVIGILVTLMVVAFALTVVYWKCYHKDKEEKKTPATPPENSNPEDTTWLTPPDAVTSSLEK